MNELNKIQSRNKAHLIEVRSVSFLYDKKNKAGRALSNVSFFVDEGERIAILGHNGSGKSTLIKILGALIVPSSGECLINGLNIQNIDFKTLRSTIGMVFQDPENQIVASMVEDDIAFSPENQGLNSFEIQKRVDLALEKVNMIHKRNSPVFALSGGEKQRVALAGALASKAKILLLDEPTAMLDPEGRIDVEKALREIHKSGTCIVQVTHQIENFDDIDRVIVLSKGEIIEEKKVDDLNLKKSILILPDLNEIKNTFKKRKNDNEKNEFEIKNLYFKFEGQNTKNVLENISFKIKKGKWLSIIGRTGSGKSTLVQHLNGLYKIQNGEIYFNDENLPQKGEKLHELRQKVGLVFQNPEDQLFSSNVHDELAFAPNNAGFSSEKIENLILHALECVGLDKNFLSRNPIALSGGEKRLVAIASVLAAEPECLVLDEPLAGLDDFYKDRILNLLKKLRDDYKTIITITHDLDMAMKFSDDILILDRGKLL